MLPPKIKKATSKKSPQWRKPGYRAYVAKHQCSVLGCYGMPIEAHHVRNGTDGGMGVKPSDYFCISLCKGHHSEIHTGHDTFEARYGIDTLKLAEAFARSSRYSFEIAEHKRERER